jgi:PhnB protein
MQINDKQGVMIMTRKISYIPEGFHTATPYLIVQDPDGAARFYEQAFDATELKRSVDADGIVRNIQIKIGDSPVMIGWSGDSNPGANVSPGDLPLVSTYLYVEDVDSLVAQAVAAGARQLYLPEDQPYGNREGGVMDPFNIVWWIATRIRDE